MNTTEQPPAIADNEEVITHQMHLRYNLTGSAYDEPTKDWIEISVPVFHGKAERLHNRLPIMIPCDYGDVERAQPIVDLGNRNRCDRLATESFAKDRQVRPKIVDTKR